MNPVLLAIAKTVILSAILFVWVVRYDNIIKEFDQFKLPSWVRDFVGILKISGAVMLQHSDVKVVELGGMLIAFLMLCAMATHVRVKNPFHKMIPSISLFLLSSAIVFLG